MRNEIWIYIVHIWQPIWVCSGFRLEGMRPNHGRALGGSGARSELSQAHASGCPLSIFNPVFLECSTHELLTSSLVRKISQGWVRPPSLPITDVHWSPKVIKQIRHVKKPRSLLAISIFSLHVSAWSLPLAGLQQSSVALVFQARRCKSECP